MGEESEALNDLAAEEEADDLLREPMGGTVVVEGWAHLGCGPWRCEKDIPEGWDEVADGNTREGDLCLVFNVKGVRKSIRAEDAKVKGKWEKVKPGNIGVAVEKLHAVIRRAV